MEYSYKPNQNNFFKFNISNITNPRPFVYTKNPRLFCLGFFAFTIYFQVFWIW